MSPTRGQDGRPEITLSLLGARIGWGVALGTQRARYFRQHETYLGTPSLQAHQKQVQNGSWNLKGSLATSALALFGNYKPASPILHPILPLSGREMAPCWSLGGARLGPSRPSNHQKRVQNSSWKLKGSLPASALALFGNSKPASPILHPILPLSGLKMAPL